MAKGLTKQYGYKCTPTMDYLEVITNNFPFHILIYQPKEINFLQKDNILFFFSTSNELF